MTKKGDNNFQEKKWGEFTTEQICEFWSQFADKTDFRNPIQAYGFASKIKENLPILTVARLPVKKDKAIFTRARIHPTKRTLFPSLSDLSYPPKILTKVGRANLPGSPVFYCSDAPGTTIYEVKPKEGDWITSMEIGIDKDEVELLAFGCGERTSHLYTDAMSNLDKGVNKFLDQLFRKEIVRGEEHSYFPTAFFTDGYLNNENGIMYPSVGSNCKGWNMIFKPDFIDRYAYFIRATVLEVVDVSNRYEILVKCKYQAETTNEYGDFQWFRADCDKGHKIDDHIYK